MVEVLANILPDTLAGHVGEFLADGLEWEYVYGKLTIYQTQHCVTGGGDPEGGFAFFFRERKPGWYRWQRGWGEEPTYTLIDGMLVLKFEEDGSEYVAVVPHDYETDDEDIHILDVEGMIESRSEGP